MRFLKFKILIMLAGCILFIACVKKKDKSGKNLQQIIETDKRFSQYSSEEGYIKAFISFADPEAVLLKPSMYPVEGKNKIVEMLSMRTDTQLSLTWEPLHGSVAKSGDLGYTYGKYVLKKVNEDSLVEKGTYVTIWKKQPDGSWKYVLDSGNEGLSDM